MRQVRTIRYRDIAADLRARVEGGEFTAGRLLPSEAEVSATYSASRVTIRKALEDLRHLQRTAELLLQVDDDQQLVTLAGELVDPLAQSRDLERRWVGRRLIEGECSGLGHALGDVAAGGSERSRDQAGSPVKTREMHRTS